MPRTSRVVNDQGNFSGDGVGWYGREEFSYTNAELATVALDDYIVVQLPFTTYLGGSTPVTQITVWARGIISIGAPTPAQEAFMRSWTTGSSVFDFPGDFIAADVSSEIAQTITVGHGFIDRSNEPGQSFGQLVYQQSHARDRLTIQLDTTVVELDASGFTVLSADQSLQNGYRLGGEVYSYTSSLAVPVQFSAIAASAVERDFHFVDSFENLQSITAGDFRTGSAGADTLTPTGDSTTTDAQTIAGLGGNDLITGGLGNDVLIGGAGDDEIRGDPSGAFGGDDALYGGDGADFLSGGFGADFLFGGAGNDALYGGPDGDLLRGGLGDDFLSGGDGHDVLDGGDGNDVLTGGAGRDYLLGGAGADTLSGGPGADTLTGGDGIDLFRDTQSDYLNGDTITDLSVREGIIFTDATLAGFTFNLTGSTLTYTGGTLTLTGGISGQLVASAASGGGVQLTLIDSDARSDFNGDGRSDILWRHDAGHLTEWLGQANGGFVDNGANAFASIGTSWSVTGIGDYNGDGRDDILWRHNTGLLTEWLGKANGGFVDNGANAFANIAITWSVAGTGDFNGDGRDDILWRHDAGHLTEWLGQANGGFVDNGANAFASIATTWSVTGIGDFNGDGRDDILWRHNTGLLTEWLGQANGGFVDNGANAFANIATTWSVAGTGDFNGDGRDDILWRHDAGHLTQWLGQANGGFVDNGANAFASIATTWSVTSIGDFNGDGRDDILWRHDTGLLTEWLGQANGGFVDNGVNAFANIATSWEVQADPFL